MKLCLSDVQIAFPDMLDFFQRHPTITSLDLTNTSSIGLVKLPPKSVLPLLGTLIANWEYHVPFLQHQLLGHFPLLNLLYLKSFPGNASAPPPLRQYENPKNPLHLVYDLLFQQRDDNLTLKIDSLSGSGLVEWALSQNMENPHQISSLSTLIIWDEFWLSPELYKEPSMWTNFTTLMEGNTLDSDPTTTRTRMLERLVWHIFPKLSWTS